MSERMIRAANLKLIKQRRKTTDKAIGKELGWSGAYVGRLINRKTPFTETTAREIEEQLGLPYRWLDEIHDQGEYDPEHAEYKAAAGLRYSDATQAPPKLAEPPPKWDLKQGVTLGGESASTDTKMFRAPVVPWGLLENAVKSSNREWAAEAQVQMAPIVPNTSERTKVCEVLESSIPTISAGDRIAVDPEAQPWHDCVVVVNGPGLEKPILRRYRRLAGEGAFEVYCPAEPPLDSVRHGLTIIGVVVALHKTSF